MNDLKMRTRDHWKVTTAVAVSKHGRRWRGETASSLPAPGECVTRKCAKVTLSKARKAELRRRAQYGG